jgi:hypothetical protein
VAVRPAASRQKIRHRRNVREQRLFAVPTVAAIGADSAGLAGQVTPLGAQGAGSAAVRRPMGQKLGFALEIDRF